METRRLASWCGVAVLVAFLLSSQPANVACTEDGKRRVGGDLQEQLVPTNKRLPSFLQVVRHTSNGGKAMGSALQSNPGATTMETRVMISGGGSGDGTDLGELLAATSVSLIVGSDGGFPGTTAAAFQRTKEAAQVRAYYKKSWKYEAPSNKKAGAGVTYPHEAYTDPEKRRQDMVNAADILIACPGGFGAGTEMQMFFESKSNSADAMVAIAGDGANQKWTTDKAKDLGVQVVGTAAEALSLLSSKLQSNAKVMISGAADGDGEELGKALAEKDVSLIVGSDVGFPGTSAAAFQRNKNGAQVSAYYMNPYQYHAPDNAASGAVVTYPNEAYADRGKRRQDMVNAAHLLIAFPGGKGTLEEMKKFYESKGKNAEASRKMVAIAAEGAEKAWTDKCNELGVQVVNTAADAISQLHLLDAAPGVQQPQGADVNVKVQVHY